MTNPETPSPKANLRVTGFRGNPLRVVLSNGDEATISQKLVDAFASPAPVDNEPVGYVTAGELAHLKLGASCIDLFGEVVPAGFEMVPLYEHPAAKVTSGGPSD